MDIALWVLAGLLAVAFLGAGGMKLATPKAKLAQNPAMAWTEDFSASQIKVVAGLEVLGAIGLVLPPLVGIAPVLAPVAALCLAVTMAGAVVVHVRRHEPPGPAAVLGLLSLVLAVGRFAVGY